MIERLGLVGGGTTRRVHPGNAWTGWQIYPRD